MAEYVRFVSYLYEYQGNERKKNVGFVRYEVRAGQKRLMVSVNGVRRPDERIPVYAFYRELDSCIGVKLGTLVLRGTRGTFQYSTYADGPGDGEPECRFEEIAGVMVMGEADTPVFCTVWDNEPFLVSSFVRCRQDLVQIRAGAVKEHETAEAEAASAVEEQDAPQQTETAQETDTEQEAESVQEAESAQDMEAAQETESVQDMETVQADEPEKAQEREAEEQPQEAPPRETGNTQQTENKAERMRESYALYRQTVWDRMCKLYPKVMPFPYNCQIGALRIRPGDIGRLPKENWALANNSFMLHGFFQYRYILLLRLPAQTEEYEERYMIAVPGVYSQMDNYLADMFGFHEFFGSPKQGSESGRFGYWVQEVRMEQGT